MRIWVYKEVISVFGKEFQKVCDSFRKLPKTPETLPKTHERAKFLKFRKITEKQIIGSSTKITEITEITENRNSLGWNGKSVWAPFTQKQQKTRISGKSPITENSTEETDRFSENFQNFKLTGNFAQNCDAQPEYQIVRKDHADENRRQIPALAI